MENQETILDYQPEHHDPELYLASTGARFANFILDRIGFYFYIFLLIGVEEKLFYGIEGMSSIFGFLFLLSIPGYWALFEYFFGKSPAKFITRTKVVTVDGRKPSFLNILGRTFCRFIPFEPFSFLGSKPVGWHDSISRTRVVSDDYPIESEEYV